MIKNNQDPQKDMQIVANEYNIVENIIYYENNSTLNNKKRIINRFLNIMQKILDTSKENFYAKKKNSLLNNSFQSYEECELFFLIMNNLFLNCTYQINLNLLNDLQNKYYYFNKNMFFPPQSNVMSSWKGQLFIESWKKQLFIEALNRQYYIEPKKEQLYTKVWKNSIIKELLPIPIQELSPIDIQINISLEIIGEFSWSFICINAMKLTYKLWQYYKKNNY